MGLNIELVMWETVRADCKYPIGDNNNGFIHGINILDENDEIIDVCWYETEAERSAVIEKEGLNIINEV